LVGSGLRARREYGCGTGGVGEGGRGGGGEKGGGVSAEVPCESGEVGSGEGEKRQQGDAVGAAETVEEVGDGDGKLMHGLIFGVIQVDMPDNLLESRASISFSIVLNYGQIEDLNSSTPLCNACVNV